jgi:hypothetical protein
MYYSITISLTGLLLVFFAIKNIFLKKDELHIDLEIKQIVGGLMLFGYGIHDLLKIINLD